jgi:rhamnogalacturonyl hydrolase YesR
MFAFAMITGVTQGWLDAATDGPAARRAWLGLVAELDADANLRLVQLRMVEQDILDPTAHQWRIERLACS